MLLNNDYLLSFLFTSIPSIAMAGYRFPYTHNEELDILKYIIDNEAYSRLRGNMLWQEMEAAGVGKQRTKQSLKEHFRKVIANRLSRVYYELSELELMRIRLGYQSTAVNRKYVKDDDEKGVDLSRTPPSSEDEDE